MDSHFFFRRRHQRRCRGRSRFDCRDLFLPVGLLGDAEFLFHLHPEFVRSATKLPHQLSKLAGNLGETLRTEEQETKKNNKGAIAEARHTWFYDTASIRREQMPVRVHLPMSYADVA